MTHFKMKVENPELFQGLRPSAVKHVLEAGVTGVLPVRDKQGRRVMWFRPGEFSHKATDIYRLYDFKC